MAIRRSITCWRARAPAPIAAQLQGLTSCRARVELRLIPVPGRSIATSDRGVAAGVDLVEALAAKAALEEAGQQACDAVVRRLAAENEEAVTVRGTGPVP